MAHQRGHTELRLSLHSASPPCYRSRSVGASAPPAQSPRTAFAAQCQPSTGWRQLRRSAEGTPSMKRANVLGGLRPTSRLHDRVMALSFQMADA
eukprot:CAMPEP_0174716920 /NCGR_PEP_ID=MMETSP1094-20130205/25257_1 /TAXON_ID=156173 /ORGANISM="Chrysochromulina brevifilum, Strain UTEX LB 985" /LENGTH=93 /DNA_ID=CAMNT_0015916785 /DNA_START=415 /DNA_END=696 /DNA_ORIENTATION=-